MHAKLPPPAAGFVLALALLSGSARAAGEPMAAPGRFTGNPSCTSSSCHGGGTGRNEAVLYFRSDQHYKGAAGLLGKPAARNYAEVLKITGDPRFDQRCNTCHAPLQSVALERLPKEPPTDETKFACETCHGPAEKWLNFHTRPDATFPQMIAEGMFNLNDLYSRANTCVACHSNLDESIRAAGHPELHFELDGQAQAEPPHYKDARPSLGPRSWLTGQATALREMSAQLGRAPEPALAPRWKALLWLLRRTEAGQKALPATGDFKAVQSAADQLARTAATTLWSREQLARQLSDYLGTWSEFGDPKGDRSDLRRRAEVLIPAIDRLWRAWKKEGATESSGFDGALLAAFTAARDAEDFDPARFAKALEELQKAFPKAAGR